jgi:hypothetical protein
MPCVVEDGRVAMLTNPPGRRHDCQRGPLTMVLKALRRQGVQGGRSDA